MAIYENPRFALSEGMVQQLRVLEHPATQTGIVNRNTALLHNLFQLPVADETSYILANAPKDDIPSN